MHLINIQEPEEEKKEDKMQNQHRIERGGIFCWGRNTCGRVVAFFADILNWICLCGLVKRLLARIFGWLYETFREKEDEQDLPPYVDPHFYQ